MKKNLHIKNKIQRFSFLLICLFILFFQGNSQKLYATSMDNYKSEFIIEELRLEIPSDFKEVWLKAEKEIWEPWLSAQNGYLGRHIFWDAEKEEALILVNWQNKSLWKSISMKEINKIQIKFEDAVKKSLNLDDNPFKLIYEGELFEQG